MMPNSVLPFQFVECFEVLLGEMKEKWKHNEGQAEGLLVSM